MATESEIDNWYTYHAPSPPQVIAYETIRGKAKELAILFNNRVLPCADATAAHRKLREAVMAMNLAIACNTPDAP